MSLSRIKTWITGDTLTAADLNAEFNNILNNGLSLISPMTANFDLGGFKIVGLALGSNGSPSISVTGNTANGIYFNDANTVSTTANGTAVTHVTATGLGIFNTSPSSPLDITASGTFTNTQYNPTAEFVVNSLDFSTAFSDEQSGNFATDALTASMDVPNTSTVHQANAIAAYIDNSDASTNSVAGYFQSRAKINSANCFGINVLLADETTTSSTLQNEFDFNVEDTSTTVRAITFTGASTAQPTDATCLNIDKIGTGISWQYGLFFQADSFTGAGINFDAGGGLDLDEPAIQIGAVDTGNNKASMHINFIGTNSGGTSVQARVYESADGDLVLRSGANNQVVAVQDYNSGSGSTGFLFGTNGLTQLKSTVAVAAPGAGFGKLRWEAGTGAGTLKLVGYSGTSTTGVTIVDNVGAGN